MDGFAGVPSSNAMGRLQRLAVLCAVLFIYAGTGDSAAAARFGEEGSGAGQMLAPSGVAVDQENKELFVADRKNNRIDKFDASGGFLLAWGWGVADGKTEAPQTCAAKCFAGLPGAGSGQFAANSAEGLAVDNDPLSSSHGDVYVLDTSNNRVEKFDSSGNFLLMFGGEVNATTHGDICIAGEQCQAGAAGTASGSFKGLGGDAIAVSSTGQVLVGDENRVQEFSPAGEVEAGAQATIAGAGFIENLAVDSTGALYVHARELLGVHKYNSGGVELGGARDEAGHPGTIALGPANELFVNDEGESHRLLEYDASGTQVAAFDAGGGEGRGGIAYADSAKLLYVANEFAAVVRLVSPPPPGPLVLSESASEVEPSSASLDAVINPEGPEPTSYHFEYGTTEAYGESTADAPLSGGAFEDQPVTTAITGLQPGREYHFRVVASNGTLSTNGPDQTFTTLPPVLVDGESATHVSTSGARLGAELNPLGSETEYHFEYGLSASYEHSAPIPEASAGSVHEDVAVALDIQGLSPGTTYHYRVVAHNGFGSVQGEDRTLRTDQEEPSVLDDGREWEMVSPANKEGVSLEALAQEGSVIQAAEDGSAFTYIAKAAIEADAPSNRSIANTQVLAKRTPSGWGSKDIETPHETVAPVLPGHLSEYQLFSGDLSSAIVQPQGGTPLSPQTSEPTPYLRHDGEAGQFCSAVGSCYQPLVSACPPAGEACPAAVEEAANAPAGTKWGNAGVGFEGASPDTSRVVVSSSRNLTADYEGAGLGGLFEWQGGRLQAVSVLPGGESAGKAGLAPTLRNHKGAQRGAVSTSGERVVFGAGNKHLYLRDMLLAKTVQLDAVQGGGQTETVAEFQGASADQSKVLFTDDGRLTGDATAKPGKPDLYECEITTAGGEPTCALKDLTVDSNPGEAANVQGEVSAFGEDGRLVYFAANGVLAAGASSGDCASAAGTCNLYVRDTTSGQTHLVAELSGLDGPDWNAHSRGELGGLTARSSADGRYLAFMSMRSLSGYDNHDAVSKEADEEVYLYDATSETVRCVSCKASGARPEGVFDANTFPGLVVDRPGTWGNRWLAGSIPGWTNDSVGEAIYQSRYLSDSGRMFFNSADALVPQDANGEEDVYQYEPQGVGSCTKPGGCQSLISSGTSSEESAFMDASSDGSSVFFITAAKLSEADLDNDFDIYDAHICTASSPCPAKATALPPPCTTSDSCRAAPAPQPSIFGAPASSTFSGAGNLAPPVVKAPGPAKAPTRAQLLAKALKSCAKKPKKRRASCRAQAHRRYGAKKAAKKAARRHAAAGKGRA